MQVWLQNLLSSTVRTERTSLDIFREEVLSEGDVDGEQNIQTLIGMSSDPVVPSS